MQAPVTPAVGQLWSAPGAQNVPLVTPLIQAAPQSSATGAAGGTAAVRIFCTFLRLFGLLERMLEWNGNSSLDPIQMSNMAIKLGITFSFGITTTIIKGTMIAL